MGEARGISWACGGYDYIGDAVVDGPATVRQLVTPPVRPSWQKWKVRELCTPGKGHTYFCVFVLACVAESAKGVS